VSRVGREAWGRWAESVAAWSLRLRGYRIVARRFRTPLGEIDLIARRGRLVAFVEVKARGDLEQALVALSLKQRQRTARGRAVPAAPPRPRRAHAALRPRHGAALAPAAPSGRRLAARLTRGHPAAEAAHHLVLGHGGWADVRDPPT
jgi:putative endonuclease